MGLFSSLPWIAYGCFFFFLETKPMDSYQSLEMASVSPDYVVAFPILFKRVGALNEAICSMLR